MVHQREKRIFVRLEVLNEFEVWIANTEGRQNTDTLTLWLFKDHNSRDFKQMTTAAGRKRRKAKGLMSRAKALHAL